MASSWKNPNLTPEQHHVITGFGAMTPSFWASIVKVQRGRVFDHHAQLRAIALERVQLTGEADDPRVTVPLALLQDAILMVIAADRARSNAELYVSNSQGDPEPSRALAAFDKLVPDLSDTRDVLMHMENYRVGTGKKAPGTQVDGPQIEYTDDVVGNEPTFVLAGHRIGLYLLAEATQKLAERTYAWWSSAVQSSSE